MGALGGAGLRIASLAAPGGLERIVGAAALAAASAVLECLLLGLAGLGGSAAALSAAAFATFTAARTLVPRRGVRVGDEALEWWRGLETWGRAAAGGVAGLAIAWTAWLLATPALGLDTLVYHLPEALDWVQSGHPGSVETVFPALPVGNYPLVNEVLLAWGLTVSRSFAAVSLLAPAAYLLLAASAWLGLRALKVPRGVAVLCTAVLCATPTLAIWQLYGAQTDLPALAWLVAAGALTARSLERPALAGPALVAAGLAIGTKTTVLPLGCLAVVMVLVVHRGRLRALARPIGLGLAAACAVGGFWYLRNLVNHGSPLWPFVAAPWGDPVPRGFLSKPLNVHFLERPGETVSRLHSGYVHLLAGSIPVFAGGLLIWLLDRRRTVIAASGVAAVSLVLWTNGPLTGVPDSHVVDSIVVSSVRYLLPGMAVAILALALATSRPGLARHVACGVLAAALVWDVVRDHSFGHPAFPPLAVPLAGIALGAALGLLAARMPLPGRLPGIATVPLLFAAGAALTPVASGYLPRHARTGLPDAGLIAWISRQSAFRDRGEPIFVAPTNVGPLAGDRLQHDLHLVPFHARCAQLEAQSRRGWIVLHMDAVTGPYAARSCLHERRPDYEDRNYRVFAPPPRAAP